MANIMENNTEQLAGDKGMKVYIIGVGLIGGSLAKDIKKKYPHAECYG